MLCSLAALPESLRRRRGYTLITSFLVQAAKVGFLGDLIGTHVCGQPGGHVVIPQIQSEWFEPIEDRAKQITQRMQTARLTALG